MLAASAPARSSSTIARRVVTVAALLAAAAALRLIALELRPPHHDEGVNGWFVEKMLREGTYRYDPANYHGPSYFYLLAAVRKLCGFGLWQLRLPGALIGSVACLLPLALRRSLGVRTAIAACVLLIVSPTLVYYARYAIHETLLGALGLVVAVAVLRWSDSGRAAWLAVAGVALAGMVATKETTIIFVGVAGLWLAGEIVVESVAARRLMVLGRAARWSWRVPVWTLAIIGAMAAIHVVLFTGGFQQPGRLADQLARSVRAYSLWTHTGTGVSGHDKPLCYYLHLAARYELALYLLAAIGLVLGRRERVVRGLAVVGFGMLGGYSLIAYKMPWLPVSWLMLLAVPAARGLDGVGRVLAAELWPRLGARAALVMAVIPALAITVRSSFVQPASAGEQLAYVHTDADYAIWFGYIERSGQALGTDRLKVSVDAGETWPLAWSLTNYHGTRWGIAGDEDIAIISTDRPPEVAARLKGVFVKRRFKLRDSAPAIDVYLRLATAGRILGARERITFTVVGAADAGVAAR